MSKHPFDLIHRAGEEMSKLGYGYFFVPLSIFAVGFFLIIASDPKSINPSPAYILGVVLAAAAAFVLLTGFILVYITQTIRESSDANLKLLKESVKNVKESYKKYLVLEEANLTQITQQMTQTDKDYGYKRIQDVYSPTFTDLDGGDLSA